MSDEVGEWQDWVGEFIWMVRWIANPDLTIRYDFCNDNLFN
jgi:hypothetical protein